MADRFQSYVSGLTAPADGAFTVIPNDAQDLAQVTRALYVGVSGDVSAVMKSGEMVSFVNVQAGTLLPLRLLRINQTGTSAQNLVGLV